MEAMERGRGRAAEVPTEIPKRGWLDILRRVKSEAEEDAVAFHAAAVAFYFLLALVPTMAAVAAIYGLFADRQTVVEHVTLLEGIVPAEALSLIADELTQLANADATSGWALILGICLAIWGSSKGIDSLTVALNVVYDEKETRGFFRRKINALLLTAALAVSLALILICLVAAPAIISYAGLGEFSDNLISFLRWPLLFVTILIALAALYRFAPCRRKPRWSWTAPGSLLAASLCVAASVGLSLYAANFGGGSKTYGSLTAVILLMTCFYLVALAVLLGGELNAESEHQTARDSTVGKPKPMGERGAYVADHLGESPAENS